MPEGRRSGLLRAQLSARSMTLGTWIKLPSMESVELVALAGFDFVVIDLEHSAMSTESAYRQIGVARLSGVAPIVRVPQIDGGLAARLLDAGAEGIMFPHVDSVADAEAAVHTVRFPPVGARGVGPTGRAGGWGAVPRDEYLRFGQEEVFVIAQIESAAAARDAEAIAAVPGVDALLVGAVDLAASEGRTEDDSDIRSLIAAAVTGGHRAGKPVGCSGGATAEAVRRAVEQGFAFALMSNDASMLGSAAAAAVAAGRGIHPIDDREAS